MPFGAEVDDGGGVRFRLWAPAVSALVLELESQGGVESIAMARDGGWFSAVVSHARPGMRYRYRLPDGRRVPDPASRAQPDDVHGASEVIDPTAFAWRDGDWRGRPFHEAVFYELHVGTFTPEGTFAAAAARLDELADLGVTAVELMPVAEAPGQRGWGYDGVFPFAPESSYGRPDDLKRFVEAAHARRLMVFLDVVYNHFGPEGNYLPAYAPQFFTDRHHTPWGAAIDFDGPASRTVRDFFVHNARFWVEEYHVDGLRLDAVHAIHDDSTPHVLVELAEAVRGSAAARHVHLVLENDRNSVRHLAWVNGRPRWYAAQWNDDFHHALHVLLTGERDGYYGDYADDPIGRLGRALAEGFAYQGDRSAHRGGAPRGEPSAHLPPIAFVPFLQNHDQVGNRAFGERLRALTSARALRAAVAILLLAPSPPLLFMGEEWGTTRPFPFFCDFGPELADAVREGRRREFASFPAFKNEHERARIPDPGDVQTFATAVLESPDAATPTAGRWRAFYRRLLAIRQREIVPRLAEVGGHAGAFERVAESGLRVRWRLGDGSELTLLANLGLRAIQTGPAQGRRIFASAPRASRSGTLPPWGVVWSLSSA